MGHFNIFPFLFRYGEISPRVPLMWVIFRRHFLQDIFILFITTTLFTSVSSPLPLFLWLHIPTVSCFFYNFIYALLNVTSSAATFCFFPAIWSLQASSLFWLSIYAKRHMGSPLGDKEATQLRALLSLLNDQLSDQSSPTGFKEVTWFVTDHDTICFLYTDLWSNELAAKFIPHEIAVLTEI